MTKVTFFTVLSAFLISILSCGKDEELFVQQGMFKVTASELENSTSHVYSYEVVSATGSYTVYIAFQDSTMTLLKYSDDSSNNYVHNYTYHIDKETLVLTSTDYTGITTTYYGSISKYLSEGEPQLVISQGDMGNLPDELVHWYNYSSINLYEL